MDAWTRRAGVGQTPLRRGRVGETIRHGGNAPWLGAGYEEGGRHEMPPLQLKGEKAGGEGGSRPRLAKTGIQTLRSRIRR